MSSKIIFKLISISLLAAIASLLLTVVISSSIPKVVNGNSEPIIDNNRVFTLEELEEAERKREEKIKESRHGDFKDVVIETKEFTLWISWAPWLLCALIFSSITYKTSFIALSVPIPLLFTGVFIPIEIVIFFIVLLLGVYVRGNYFNLKST